MVGPVGPLTGSKIEVNIFVKKAIDRIKKKKPHVPEYFNQTTV